ncbi:MAG: NADP-dependent malic enzyme [Clostridiales bacterium]|nr:NADP-dependent malic enzyme [Clostridiales bacterium]
MTTEEIKKLSLQKHAEWKGKISVKPTVKVETPAELSLAYTPGVAEPCLEIQKDVSKSYDYTRRWNTIAVITDGTAVLGLGDIGPEAGMPVMEGKCLLFSQFAGIDAIPLCVKSKSVDEIVRTVSLISGSFGGINLEDISAPRCFEIERRLKEICDIPIFHDDQHGTAVVALAALENALKVVGKKKEDVKIVINGAGAAGTAAGRLFMRSGAKNVIFVDRTGAISKKNPGITSEHALLAGESNPHGEDGTLADVIKGADVFLGVSKAGLLTPDMVKTMNKDAIIFAMANPVPEIMPNEALAAGAAIVGTGRSDFKNQINNLMAFPGIFRGALDARASDINEEMKIAAAKALEALVGDDLSAEYILPSPLDERAASAVSKAVKEAAEHSGVARI